MEKRKIIIHKIIITTLLRFSRRRFTTWKRFSPRYTLPRLANVETMPKQGHKSARMSKSEYSGISRTVTRSSNGKRNSHE